VELDDYLQEKLIPRLTFYGLDRQEIDIVSADVRNRLTSMLCRWNVTAFRQTMLVIGEEEGSFYHPEANLDIRSLVVLTVRNSALEVLVSSRKATNYPNLPAGIIPDEHIRLFTGDAIDYWSRIDLRKLARKLVPSSIDPYGRLRTSYPLAWAALYALGEKRNRLEHSYRPVVAPSFSLPSLRQGARLTGASVQSGIDPVIDSGLQHVLNCIANDPKICLYVDSCFFSGSLTASFSDWLTGGSPSRAFSLLLQEGAEKPVRIVDPGDTPRNQRETPSREMTKLERSDRPKNGGRPFLESVSARSLKKGPTTQPSRSYTSSA